MKQLRPICLAFGKFLLKTSFPLWNQFAAILFVKDRGKK